MNLEQKLRELYLIKFKSIKEIGQELGCSDYFIRMYFKQFNIVCRKANQKYTFDTNYFKIPNLDNSYWAGWLATDGSINSRPNTIYKTLELSLQYLDYQVVETFRQNVKYTGLVHELWNRDKTEHRCQLRINSVENNLSIDLERNFNIVPRKTFILQGPNITDSLMILHYLKGAIEGDGCLYHYIKENKLRLSLASASMTYLDWAQSFLNQYFNTTGKIKEKGPKHSAKSLEFNKRDSILISSCLSELKTPYHLSRKWDKVKQFLPAI